MSEIWRFLWPAALLMAFSLHGLALDAYGQSDCITATSPNTMTVIFPQESLTEGDTVRARSAVRDLCAGEAAAQENGALGLTVRGDDSFDEVIGFDANEPFDLYLVDGDNEQRLSITADLDGDGPRVGNTAFQHNTILVVDTWQPATQGHETITLSADTVHVPTGATFSVDLEHSLHSISMKVEGIEEGDILSMFAQVREDSTINGDLHVTGVDLAGQMVFQGTLLESRSVSFEALEAVAEVDGELAEVTASFEPATLTLLTMLLGDINNDGIITMADVRMALRHVMLCNLAIECLTTEQRARGDMTQDGQVRLLDAALIYQAME